MLELNAKVSEIGKLVKYLGSPTGLLTVEGNLYNWKESNRQHMEFTYDFATNVVLYRGWNSLTHLLTEGEIGIPVTDAEKIKYNYIEFYISKDIDIVLKVLVFKLQMLAIEKAKEDVLLKSAVEFLEEKGITGLEIIPREEKDFTPDVVNPSNLPI